MISSDFRTEARRKLDGKWGKAACMILAYVFVFFVFGLIQSLFPESMQGILSLIVNIIELPLGFGLIVSLVKLFYDEEVNAFSFWSIGFKNFVKPWGITWNIFLKMIIPYILIIVAYVLIIFGIFGSFATYLTATDNVSSLYYYNSYTSGFSALLVIGFILLIASAIWAVTKFYYYQLAYVIAAKDLDLSAKDAVLRSKELMQGKRSKLFFLQLSFIGWAILAVFTFGIGYLWLLPYMQFATIAFYDFVAGNDITAEVIQDNSEEL